jgi:hypothetical protein
MTAPLTTGGEEPSVGIILSRLWDKTERLLRQELALALAEIDQRVDDTRSRVVRAVIGGAVTFAGSLALLWASILLLSYVVALWLAAIIVGGTVTLMGLAMLMLAKPSPMKPGLRTQLAHLNETKAFHGNEATHDAT